MKYLVSITFLILSQLMAQPNQSNIPLNLSYQGLVTQTDGAPFEDGEYLMTFRLYVENENGEDQLMWEEEHSVQLSQGVFSAVLGSIVDLPDNIPSHAVLETQVNDDILNPRQPFTSVPFALKSNRSNMAINAMYSDSSLTSEFALHSITADTANFVLNAPSADTAQFAHHASQADHALAADSSGVSETALFAEHAEFSQNAMYAQMADTANFVLNAPSADTAQFAHHASQANHALAADSAGVSETALFANSAAEAGSLENVITTPDELNYVSGVTSSIQEQLDSKGTGSVNTLLDLGITNTPEVLNSVSGVNTGDQDITGITDNATNIAMNASNIETNTDAITLNTVKVGITPEQADAIVANTAKVGITTDQANAITANTAKIGVPTAYTLSETDGTSGQVLSTDGAGNVSWSNAAVDTDTQDLSLSGNTISLVDGGSVDISTTTAVAANTAKVGLTTTQSTLLDNTSGVNTGDQDISGISTNATNIATNESNIETNTDAITLNTVKVGITPEQADAIVANTAKVGITTDQANAITANTAKVGVPSAYTLSETDGTSGQVLSTDGAGNVSWSNAAVDTDTQDLSLSGNTISLVDGGSVDISTTTAVAANTAKVGITTDQANAITANTAKVGITTDQANAIATNTAKVGITTDQANAIEANTAKVGLTSTQSTLLDNTSGVNTGDQDISGISTNATNIATNTSAIAANTAKVGITTDQANAITANTAKTGITSSQANAITANTAKVGVPTAYTLASTDGTSGQILSTDGAGNVSWSNAAVDTDTQDLSLSGNTISLVDGGSVDVSTTTAVAANTAKVGVPTAYTLPSADGSSSQVLSTDGSGSVSWSSVSITEVADEFSATTSQTSFTLTQTPSSNSKVKMFINGIRISNSAYSISGTTLTYISSSNGSYSLVSGDRIQFDYHY